MYNEDFLRRQRWMAENVPRETRTASQMVQAADFLDRPALSDVALLERCYEL